MKRRVHLDIACSTGTFARNARDYLEAKERTYDFFAFDTVPFVTEDTPPHLITQIRFGSIPDGDNFRDWLKQWATDPRVLSGSRIALHACKHEEPGSSWPACVEDDVWVKP